MEKLRKFETEEQYLNEKESLEYPQVSLTQDNGKVWIKENNIIKFYLKDSCGNIINQPLYSEKNMTWEEWFNSQYNYIDNIKIFDNKDINENYVNLSTNWDIDLSKYGLQCNACYMSSHEQKPTNNSIYEMNCDM